MLNITVVFRLFSSATSATIEVPSLLAKVLSLGWIMLQLYRGEWGVTPLDPRESEDCVVREAEWVAV